MAPLWGSAIPFQAILSWNNVILLNSVILTSDETLLGGQPLFSIQLPVPRGRPLILGSTVPVSPPKQTSKHGKQWWVKNERLDSLTCNKKGNEIMSRHLVKTNKERKGN